MEAQVAAFVSRRWLVPEGAVRVDVRPLHGGLESAVTLASIRADAGHPAVPAHLVIKQLRAGLEREAAVYEWLWRHMDRPPTVRVLGRESVGRDTYLYLEHAEAPSNWPWSDTAAAAAVCGALARLHDGMDPPSGGFPWDYETELAASAEATLRLACEGRNEAGRRHWRRLGDMRRVVGALPALRSRLLAADRAVIHGDVHPGNAFVCAACPDAPVVLIDWARARIGSPLEDVASWLHSLGCWEPQARRRHDTLVRAYLDARRVRRAFGAELRADYWFASASNGLAGAIRYHLAILGNPQSTGQARGDSQRALRAWERVVRRAAALLSTSCARCS